MWVLYAAKVNILEWGNDEKDELSGMVWKAAKTEKGFKIQYFCAI